VYVKSLNISHVPLNFHPDKSSVNGAIDNLVYISPQREFLYITDLSVSSPYSQSQPLPSRRFEHLSCFFPGVLALGAQMLTDDEITPQEREKWQWAAEGIAWGCALMYRDTVCAISFGSKRYVVLTYARQPTGIGPEEVVVRYQGTTNKPDSDYVLRYGRWKELVETWEAKGRPHEKPPGVGHLPNPVKHGMFRSIIQLTSSNQAQLVDFQLRTRTTSSNTTSIYCDQRYVNCHRLGLRS
jgi:hypothetical protein